jgi:N-glycosylase/DNA lyase
MQTLTVKNKYFSVFQTLTCGQVFRYKQINECEFQVISRDKICYLSQKDDNVTLKTEHMDYFKESFDLERDYGKIEETLETFDELKIPVSYGKGIRILKQDFYETVISFIISANNNIKRIQKIIETLCEQAGDKKDGFYAFPTAKQLQKFSVQDFVKMGLGYRAQYLYETCRTIDSVGNDILSSTSAEAYKKLLALKGIGPKVANCIMLFGMAITDSYPVDTWIFKANRTEELNTAKKVCDYYTARYGQYAGFAQQYIFFHARSELK